MRLVSILSALVVGLLLYAFVMERDLLRALAGAEPETQSEAAATDEAAAEDKSEITTVVAERSEERALESGIVMRGRTEASRRVEVRSETTGLVISEPLRRGAMVEPGALLCALDPGSRPAQLAEAEARLLEARANERASAGLAERGFGAETTAIANRAALHAAEALVDLARREIERLEIHAPFRGLLESDTAELGSLLQPGSDCATVLAMDPIKLIGYVPETQVSRVALGARASARLLSGDRLMAQVTFVARSADPDTRTFRVEATAPNPDLAVRDGLTAEILVEIEGARGHLVPQSALTLDDDGRIGVRSVVDGRAQFMPVTVIRDAADGVWVDGLPKSLDLIVVGQDFVIDDEPVEVTQGTPKT